MSSFKEGGKIRENPRESERGKPWYKYLNQPRTIKLRRANMGGIFSIFFSGVHGLFQHLYQGHRPTEATEVQQAEDSSSTESSPESSVTERDNHLDQSGNVTRRTETIFPCAVTSDHIDDVDKKNIYVICGAKCKEFGIFPLETISVLLQEACDWAKKKPQKMNLVFKGEHLDVMKTLREYPGLRAGSRVHLIHAC